MIVTEPIKVSMDAHGDGSTDDRHCQNWTLMLDAYGQNIYLASSYLCRILDRIGHGLWTRSSKRFSDNVSECNP